MQNYRIESFVDARPITTAIVQSSSIQVAVAVGARETRKKLKGRRIHQLVVRATKI